MLPLALAAGLAFLLGRRLAGESGPALAAAAAFGLAPALRGLAAADPRLAWAAALWPALLLCFYAEGSSESERAARLWRGAQAAALLTLGLLDPRAAIAGGALVWGLIAGGWLMAGRRRWADWRLIVTGWAQACLGGVVLYAPAWWLRLNYPGIIPAVPEAPPPGPYPLGWSVVLLASAGAALSRSYRGPARLWAGAAALLAWLSLGPVFVWQGRPVWWVPALGRLFARLWWLGGVGSGHWAALAALALSVASAFGAAALAGRLPLTGRRWSGPALGAAAAGAVLAELLRN